MGDKAILEAMRTNEADTNTAYERAIGFGGIDSAIQDTLERGLEDERRHCGWILEQLRTLWVDRRAAGAAANAGGRGRRTPVIAARAPAAA
jgi:hypothetical protein